MACFVLNYILSNPWLPTSKLSGRYWFNLVFRLLTTGNAGALARCAPKARSFQIPNRTLSKPFLALRPQGRPRAPALPVKRSLKFQIEPVPGLKPTGETKTLIVKSNWIRNYSFEVE